MKLLVLVCLAAAALARPSPQYSPRPRAQQQEAYDEQQPLTYSRAPARELSESRLRDREAQITSFTNEQSDKGAHHSFETDNGLQREETIQLREVVVLDDYGKEVVKTVPIFKGSFQFLQDDGSLVTRSYTTDETGRIVWEGSDVHQGIPAPPPAPAYQ